MVPAAAILALFAWGHTSPATKEKPYDVHAAFLAFDPNYRQRIALRKDRLEALQRKLYEKTLHGSSACSREVNVEAQWLTYYTADYAAIDKQLERLESVVRDTGTPNDEKVQAEDGTYAPCHNAWFYKLDRTCDRLTMMSETQLRAQKRLTFLDRINSPTSLLHYLNSKLISDISRKGVNNSFELNLAATDLLRLINGHLPSGYPFRPELRQTIQEWVNHTWQDPQTGCFGPWYMTPKGIRKAIDLSSTFHVVDYTEGNIGHWPQLVTTLFAIKDGPWPQGWLQQGRLSNHHDFDVVTLFPQRLELHE